MLDPEVKSPFIERQVDRCLRSRRSEDAWRVKSARKEHSDKIHSRKEIVCSQGETRSRSGACVSKIRSRLEKRSREYYKKLDTWLQEVKLPPE